MREVAAAEIETPRLIPSIVQQRSDKGAFFRQEMFRSKIARIAARAFFVAVHSKYGSANRNDAGRFRTSCAHVGGIPPARPVISFLNPSSMVAQGNLTKLQALQTPLRQRNENSMVGKSRCHVEQSETSLAIDIRSVPQMIRDSSLRSE